MNSRNYLLLVLIIILCSCTSKNSDRYNKAILQSSQLIDNLMQVNQIPGLAITVNVEGKNVWSKGFGYSDLEKKVPASPCKTRFRIGSISKPITSDALIQLHSNGKLHLDSIIQKYLPDFPIKKGSITPRLVAGHLAGIRHYRNGEFMSSKHYNKVEDALEIFKEDTLISFPGTQYHYSSYGWNLLSAVIEKASQENFLSYMDHHIFKPLNMTHSCADINDSIIPDRSSFYSSNGDKTIINAPYVDNSCKWAGGGFISTSEDIMRFAVAHTHNGYLSKQQIDQLITPMHDSQNQSTEYGLGWHHSTNSYGIEYFGHSGGSIGGTSQMVIYPNKHIAVVILCNQGGVKFDDIQHKIANLFITKGTR